jgi:hypothetical protein
MQDCHNPDDHSSRQHVKVDAAPTDVVKTMSTSTVQVNTGVLNNSSPCVTVLLEVSRQTSVNTYIACQPVPTLLQSTVRKATYL